MSSSKKREGRSERRQNIFNRAILVSVLIVVIIFTAYLFTRPTSVTLPDYLKRCIPGGGPFVYQSAPQLLLNISGVDYAIPANLGIVGQCLHPLSTVDQTGVIHIVTDVDRNYTLGDFFLIWGNRAGPDFAKFNQNEIFNYRADSGHTLQMTVNGSPDYSFQDYVFPRNASFAYHRDLIAIHYL